MAAIWHFNYAINLPMFAPSRILHVQRKKLLIFYYNHITFQLTTKSFSTTSQTELENRLHALTESLIHKQTMLEALSTEKNSLGLQLERLEVSHIKMLCYLHQQTSDFVELDRSFPRHCFQGLTKYLWSQGPSPWKWGRCLMGSRKSCSGKDLSSSTKSEVCSSY